MEFPNRTNNLYKEHFAEPKAPEPVETAAFEGSPGCENTLTAGQGTYQFCTENIIPNGYPGPPRLFQFDTNVENLINTPKWKRDLFTPEGGFKFVGLAILLVIMYHLFRA